MSTNTSENRVAMDYVSEAANGEFFNIESIESIYTEDSIDTIELNIEQPVAAQQAVIIVNKAAANDPVNEASVYSISGARRAKLDKSLERRSSKSRLSDRRQNARLSASGEPEQDRREENRIANVESLRP